MNRKYIILLIILINIVTIGCDNKQIILEEYVSTDDEVLETEYIPIDYEALEEEGHQFLNKNICENPLPIKENAWLCQQIQLLLDMVDESKKYHSESDYTMDYFTFDLNDDGLDDYIISIDGYGWHGSHGHTVMIYKQTTDGLEVIMDLINELHNELHDGVTDYWPIAILDEKTDGYYDIVLPWSKFIWKYDKEVDGYDTVQQYRQLL